MIMENFAVLFTSSTVVPAFVRWPALSIKHLTDNEHLAGYWAADTAGVAT